MGRLKWLVLVGVGAVLALGVAGGSAGGQEASSGGSAVLTIVAPEAGCVANVGDVLEVLLVVQEGAEVASVAVLCDAKGVGMLQAPPYTVRWDTGGWEAGEHVLRAFAYLKSGERVGAAPVVVTLAASSTALPTGPGPSVAQPPVVLKEGTPVLLQTEAKMISGKIAENAPVRYRVMRDVTGPGGQVLVAYGDSAQGHVTRSRRRGMFGKAGQLEFTVDSVTATDGGTVPLRAEQQLGGKDNKGVVIISTLLLSVFAVFIHGKDVEVPERTEVMAYVDHDTSVSASATVAAGAPRGEPVEAASIVAPAAGQQYDKGQRIEIRLSVTPEQKFGRARLLVDDKEVAKVERTLAPFTVTAGSLGVGRHRLEAEVQFLNGYLLRTVPVEVEVKGD